MYDVNLSEDGQIVTIASDPSIASVRFHAIWLRDNAWDGETRSTGNGQRLITLRDIPTDNHINQAKISGQILQLTFQPENKTIDYDLTWLMNHAYDQTKQNPVGWVSPNIETWDNRLLNTIPNADFVEVQNNSDSLHQWLQQVVRYGFGKLTNGPTEDQSLMRVVDLFGYVRETNYGRHFEVRTEINPTNLAFTNLGLQAHTDNPYRDPVPSIQILYCLESSAEGGENMVVDGFHAARLLRDKNIRWFDVLSKYCARFEYAGEKDVILRSRRPMIELSPDGEIIGVRFNNRSAAAITDVPFEDMADYYQAYRQFGEIINNPAMEVTFKLSPGECFIVDNTRVLHARKAYSGTTGKRWLQGCYADKDGLRSKLDSLTAQRSEVA